MANTLPTPWKQAPTATSDGKAWKLTTGIWQSTARKHQQTAATDSYTDNCSQQPTTSSKTTINDSYIDNQQLARDNRQQIDHQVTTTDKRHPTVETHAPQQPTIDKTDRNNHQLLKT